MQPAAWPVVSTEVPINQAPLQRMPSVVDRLFNVYMLDGSRLCRLQYNLTT